MGVVLFVGLGWFGCALLICLCWVVLGCCGFACGLFWTLLGFLWAVYFGLLIVGGVYMVG